MFFFPLCSYSARRRKPVVSGSVAESIGRGRGGVPASQAPPSIACHGGTAVIILEVNRRGRVREQGGGREPRERGRNTGAGPIDCFCPLLAQLFEDLLDCRGSSFV